MKPQLCIYLALCVLMEAGAGVYMRQWIYSFLCVNSTFTNNPVIAPKGMYC